MQRGRIQAGDILVVKDGATTGKVSFVPSDWPFDKSAANEHVFVLRPNREALAEYLFFYLYSPVGQHDIKKSFHGSAQGGINQSFAAHVPVPLPPLPVQERIVQILQKADEIRRKRKEALDLADKLLPALFLDMFGDPATNPKGFEKATIGSVASLVTSGWTPRGGARNYVADGPLLLRSQNVQMLRLDLSDCAHLPEPLFAEMDRVHVRPGDVLMNITGKGTAGRVAWIAEDDLRAAVNQHVCIIRCNQDRMLAPFLALVLSMPHYQAIIGRAPGSTQSGFNHSRVRALDVLVPPMPLQRSFLSQVEMVVRAHEKLTAAQADAAATFENLMSQAFTGELTADWEAVNAEAIRQRQAFEEQVPRLVALDLLAEKAASTAPAAPEAGLLLTAMMKLLFLVQMKGSARRRFYHFVPYHYGPFAKELYDDLERLQQEGLVSIEQADEDKTRLVLADADLARQMVAQLPDDLRQDVRTVLDEYGGLTHNQLLARVYEEFPAYARRSRLRHAAKKAGTGKSAT
jgi:type I restriction enzyme S subunit